jgi:leucyl aminopeptidase
VYSASFNPHTVIDVATLTGGIGKRTFQRNHLTNFGFVVSLRKGVALGPVFAGAFTRSDELWREIELSGLQTHERFWRMPLVEDYRTKHLPLEKRHQC